MQALYGSGPPTASESLPEYLDAGGWLFEQHESIGQNADEVLSRLAEHGRHPLPPLVALGPYNSVVIHADPILRNGLRPWQMYWSDGSRDFSVQANRRAAFVVAVGRSLYCPTEAPASGQ